MVKQIITVDNVDIYRGLEKIMDNVTFVPLLNQMGQT